MIELILLIGCAILVIGIIINLISDNWGRK